MSQPVRATLEEARVAPIQPGLPLVTPDAARQHGAAVLRARGALTCQTPHDRDELYVVASGRGTFFVGGQRVPFGPGDVLFVAATVEHRFEDFSEDFATWVVFYGPSGGERG